MKKVTSLLPLLTIGLDVSDRYTQLCALDAGGTVIEEARLRTSAEALRSRFAGLPPCRVALEAGTHSGWMARLLTEFGHEVLVANARRLALISHSDTKSDRADAEKLARLARLDPKLLSPIRVREEQELQHLAVVRSRDLLVRERTRLGLHVRGVLKASGLPTTSLRLGAPRQALAEIPQPLRPALVPVLEMLVHVQQQIKELDRQVRHLADKVYPQTERLRQVFGVGELTSLCFVLMLHDPQLRKSRAAGAYVGLVPRRNQSGQRDPELHITKAGDELLRRLLVQCAQVILGPRGEDSDLRRWGLALAARGGKAARRRAVIAVARRLAVLLHALWRTGTVYEPLRIAQRDAA